MKKILTAATLAAVALPALLASCSQDRTKAASEEGISEFAVDQTIKSAEKNYLAVFGEDSAYYQKSTVIHWPDRIGQADLTALRDTLMSYCYGVKTGDLNPAIKAYLADTLSVAGLNPTPIDSVPDDAAEGRVWYDYTSANVLEINSDYATYEVTQSSYLGGAHPMTVTRPFTYDLAGGRVLAADDLFVPGSTDALLTVIRETLAQQYNIRPSQLAMAGINVEDNIGTPYLMGGAVVFHYNPYEIAPYSLGSIDATVYPWALEGLLTPEAKTLLDRQF